MTIVEPINRIASIMTRHLFGAFLCLLLITAAASSAYSDSLKNEFSTTLNIETSYVSPDSSNDLGDMSYPDGLSGTTRGSVIAKIALGTVLRKFRFSHPADVSCQRPGYCPSTSQDLFRFHQVYRI